MCTSRRIEGENPIVRSPSRPRTDFAVVTVVTRDYLHYARALAASIRDVDPNLELYVCLVDRPPDRFDPTCEPAACFFADTLSIPHWQKFRFQYTPFEIACALKPFAMDYVRRQGFRKVLYLDADMQVYHSLDDFADSLERCDILLTPHLRSPKPDDCARPEEISILRAGAYNAGFVAIRDSTTSQAFLRWWGNKMLTSCVVDLAAGLHVDQRWLDLVPGMFSGVVVERNPVFNAGYWTLAHYDLSRTESGNLLLADAPLVTFHFSGFDPSRARELSVHTDCKQFRNPDFLYELQEQYARRLSEWGSKECEAWGYEFAHLRDGTPIKPLWRESVRSGLCRLGETENPFDTQQGSTLYKRFQRMERRTHRCRRDWWLDWLQKRYTLRGRMSRIKKAIIGWCSTILRIAHANQFIFTNRIVFRLASQYSRRTVDVDEISRN